MTRRIHGARRGRSWFRWVGLFAAVAALLLAAPGCGDDDGGGTPPQLTSSHPGWDRADCASCHQTADIESIHGTSREWYECFGCHGGNNQPARPAGHSDTGCTGCHSQGVAPWNDTTHAGYVDYTGDQCRGCHDAS